MNRNRNDALIFAIAILITLLSIAYWLAYNVYAYNTYRYFADLGIFSYNFYFNLHYPGIAQGFQLLVFGNHIAPDMYLLVMPFYILNQSTLTLLFVQSIFICITGFVIFLVTKDLTKNSMLALAFCAAFLLNPGIQGMLRFDFHAEAFVIMFYVLTFYFYMKGMRWLFFASLFLLLGTLESTVIVALALGVGLFIYGMKSKDKAERRQRMRYAAYVMLASILAALLYYGMTATLFYNYKANAYPDLPNVLLLTPGSQNLVLTYFRSFISNPVGVASAAANVYSTSVIYLTFGVIVALFAYGLLTISDPLLIIIFILPWLAGAFILVYPPFLLIFYQYFGFAIGGSTVGAIIGYITLDNKRNLMTRFARIFRIEPHAFAAKLALLFALVLFMSSFLFLFAFNAPLYSGMLFYSSQQQLQAYSQLNYVLRYLPSNASVLVQYEAMPHIANRENISLLAFSINGKPQYILVDFNTSLSGAVYADNQYGYFTNYIGSNPYILLERNGTAMLYKRE